MDDNQDTRIYWEGNEVTFLQWTNKGLVFSWEDPRETAINMPRGTVRRLMAKGVLRIEGSMPAWTYEDEPESLEIAPLETKRKQPKAKMSSEQKTKRVGMLARLIRKLGTEGTS